MAEVEYLLMLVRDLGYANAETIKPHLQEADEIGRMLYVFRKRLEDGDDEG